MERTKFKRMSIDRVFGKEVGLECDACQGASRRKVTKAITAEENFMGGNEKSDALEKDGAEVDGEALGGQGAVHRSSSGRFSRPRK